MPKPAVADILERCAMHAHDIAFDFREGFTTQAAFERACGEVERIAAAMRTSVRGNRSGQ